MSATKQIETYATKLSELARVSIVNEDLLEELNRSIKLYKDKIITKPQLTKVYKSITKQVKYENQIKKLKLERDYVSDMYKILYIKTEYIDILDSASVTTEEVEEIKEEISCNVISCLAIEDYNIITTSDDTIFDYEIDEVKELGYKYPDHIFKNIISYCVNNEDKLVMHGAERDNLAKHTIKNVKFGSNFTIIDYDLTDSKKFKECIAHTTNINLRDRRNYNFESIQRRKSDGSVVQSFKYYIYDIDETLIPSEINSDFL